MEIVTVTCTCRPSMWNNLADNLLRQTRKPDALLIRYHKTQEEPGLSYLDTVIKNLNVIPAIMQRADDNFGLSQMMASAFTIADSFFIEKEGLFVVMDDDDWYGPAYLQQLEDEWYRHRWHNVPVAMFGKSDYWCRWPERKLMKRFPMDSRLNVPVASVAGSSIAIDREFWTKHKLFRHDPKSYWADACIIESCHSNGGHIYNTGPDNYFAQRYDNPNHKHGWRMPEQTEGLVSYEQ